MRPEDVAAFFDDGPSDLNGQHYPAATIGQLAAASIPTPSPSALEPLTGLVHLSKVATIGLDAIRALAARPIDYVWAPIAVSGTIILLAGGPGEGKTTLLFLILAARLNLGEPVKVLGKEVRPAPLATWIVVIEGEHSESSAARKLLRSMALLGVHDVAAGHIILIARKAVRIGSPEWEDVGRLVSAGLISDIMIDTLARVAPAEANSEQEQTAIFEQIASTIEKAPNETAKPTVWAAAHTRKNGRIGDVSDVLGSVQRVGQADTVLLAEAERIDGRVISSKVTFGKIREEPLNPDEYPTPVSFSISSVGLSIADKELEKDDRPLETRIEERLRLIGPMTANALEKALKRSHADVQESISALFASRIIKTTEMMIKGVPRRHFAIREDTP